MMRIVFNIPEEATNGDMIETIFPDCQKCKVITDKQEIVVFNLKDIKEWWNAPYKAESEEE